jgi:hypothetical protein
MKSHLSDHYLLTPYDQIKTLSASKLVGQVSITERKSYRLYQSILLISSAALMFAVIQRLILCGKKHRSQ